MFKFMLKKITNVEDMVSELSTGSAKSNKVASPNKSFRACVH